MVDMKCKVCGAESGKYPLCRACNIKKEKGEIIKCNKCNNWHNILLPCPIVSSDEKYLYSLKNTLISRTEQSFYGAIKGAVPEGFMVFPQVNLAAFINRTDDARFHNELFRNIDFLITDDKYQPKVVIEINDQTHLNADRKERDEKVKKICEEAGIPIIKLWTSYGVKPEYIKTQIEKQLNALPAARIHHFSNPPLSQKPVQQPIYQQPVERTEPQPVKQKSASRKKRVYGIVMVVLSIMCILGACVNGTFERFAESGFDLSESLTLLVVFGCLLSGFYLIVKNRKQR